MQSSHAHTDSFPLPFPYLRIRGERTDKLAAAPFLISAMLTDNYSEHADRLAQSCEERGLQYILYEVPEVHKSISPKGTANPSFTKANFIHFLLETHVKPILYVDADCVLTDSPGKIEELVCDGYDFAIYNWLADEHTEGYVPVEIKLMIEGKIQTFTDRFYRFGLSIDYYSVDQLICSGAVQYYNNTGPARALLRNWHRAVLEHAHTADDKCLDYAFNNLPSTDVRLNAAWLTKAYARYAWWIYERPVINHPDIPYSGNSFRDIQDRPGARRVYSERVQLREVEYYFPKDCLIDTEKRMLVKVHGNQLTPIRPLARDLWL